MSCMRRVASAVVVISALAFASAGPATAGSQSPRKHDYKCSLVAKAHAQLQARRDRLAERPLALSDPDAVAHRQKKLAKFDERLAVGKSGC